MSDTDGVIARFTNDIWPAINGYNGIVAAQGGPEDRAFYAVMDPGLKADNGLSTYYAYNALRDAVHGLGQVGHARVMRGYPFRDAGGLRLGSAVLTALDPPAATLKVCYTYTLTLGADNPMPPQPAASEVTVELHKTDAWDLHSITDDHVVPGCESINS